MQESNERNNCAASGTRLTVIPAPLPDNVEASARLEHDRSVTQTMSWWGGTFETTSGDGAHFVLEVPPLALAGAETIVMTPLSGADGVPFANGVAAAVDLRPHGLVLKEPATLTITTPSSFAFENQATFAYDGEAAGEVYLYPTTQETSTIRLSLSHFSGYGVANAAPGEQAAQAARTPSDAGHRAQQQVASLVREALVAGEQPDQAALGDVLETWAESVIGDIAAANSDAALSDAVRNYLDWARTVDLFGGGRDSFRSYHGTDVSWFDLMERALRTAYKRAIQRALDECRSSGGPAAVRRVLGLLKQAHLLGLEGFQDPLAEMRRCLRFRLEMESVIDFDDSSAPARGTVHLEGDVMIVVAGPLGPGLMEGQGTIRFVDGAIEIDDGDGCSETLGAGQPGTLLVQDVHVGGGALFTAWVFNLIPPYETVSVACPGSSGSIPNTSFWTTCFAIRHPHDYFEDQTWLVAGMELVGSRVWARKTYEGSTSRDSMSCTERTTLTLFHEPL